MTAKFNHCQAVCGRKLKNTVILIQSLQSLNHWALSILWLISQTDKNILHWSINSFRQSLNCLLETTLSRKTLILLQTPKITRSCSWFYLIVNTSIECIILSPTWDAFLHTKSRIFNCCHSRDIMQIFALCALERENITVTMIYAAAAVLASNTVCWNALALTTLFRKSKLRRKKCLRKIRHSSVIQSVTNAWAQKILTVSTDCVFSAVKFKQLKASALSTIFLITQERSYSAEKHRSCSLAECFASLEKPKYSYVVVSSMQTMIGSDLFTTLIWCNQWLRLIEIFKKSKTVVRLLEVWTL